MVRRLWVMWAPVLLLAVLVGCSGRLGSSADVRSEGANNDPRHCDTAIRGSHNPRILEERFPPEWRQLTE